MNYSIHFAPGIERDMSRLPRVMRVRIDKVITALAYAPRPSGCKKLAGHPSLYRLRVGDWRVVYEIDDAGKLIIIAIVGHRSDIYRGL